ncbi:hypothetical protein O3M35_012811 [Rhynocoris fuscipes]
MKLYSWGANTHGQLGQGVTSEEVLKPTEIFTDHLPLNEIVSIEIGGNQSYLIAKDGSVFGCGWNNCGQLGHEANEENLFIKLNHLENFKIKQISCKWDTCYAITDKHYCIGWGGNQYGQLGLPPEQLKKTLDPVIICYNAVQVAAGLRHCAILLNYGKVVTAGTNKRGQLGRPSNEENPMFDFVSELKEVEMISSGQNFSLALTKDKKLYGWGCNKFGQLGIVPDSCPFTEKPVEIQLSPPLTKCELLDDITIMCGWTHTLLRTAGKKLFAWGRNNYGQLGSIADSYSIELIKVLPGVKIRKIAAGAEHNLVYTEEGFLRSWGWNEHGSCGDNSISPVILHPTTILAPDKK